MDDEDMKNPSNEFLKNKIWALPYGERVSMLTLSIMKSADKNEPLAAVLGLIELVSRMSQYFSEDKRFRLADRLRNAADLVEKTVLVDEKG
jgi:hypothetical protein